MKKELRLKPIKNEPANELEAFVNTIYNEIYNEMDNLNQQIRQENEPLHHLILVTRLEVVRNNLKLFERIVEDVTEYVEVEEDTVEEEDLF